MSGIVRLDRRAFMRNAGATAIAGAAGGLVGGASSAAAQSSSSIPRLPNGKYDFDTPYNRVGTDCSRWDSPAVRYPEGVFKYGMGVASMDFECAPCITEALQERIQHHNWGYLSTTQPLRDGILKWNGERHGLGIWTPPPSSSPTVSIRASSRRCGRSCRSGTRCS